MVERVFVGSPRTEGPSGGKVPAAGAKRRLEVRGLVKRHRLHFVDLWHNESQLLVRYG